MDVKQIIVGHVNEALGKEQKLFESRMAICNSCPLKVKKSYGLVCDHTRWLNPETNEVSYIEKDGFFQGCGCRLNAKLRIEDTECPAGKW